MKNQTATFAPGDSVFVNKTPKQSAFGGWQGAVRETRPSGLGVDMVHVDFTHPIHGDFPDVGFLPGELAESTRGLK
jgi:hypothetical protein